MRRLALTLGTLVLFGLGFAAAMPSNAAADLNCTNFTDQASAQSFLYPGDPNELDSDFDGLACEHLPCPCSTGIAQPPPSETPVRPEAPARPLVFWKSFGSPSEIEPRKLVVGSGAGSPLYLSRLENWQGWGSGRASAFGKVLVNTCRPFCAASNFTTRRARVVLTKVRATCGQRRYMNVKIRIFNFSIPVIGPWGSDCRGAQVKRP
jgi:hypothetical protein